MALRFKISKAEYEKLPEEIKAEYTLSGDNATLDLEGGPDPKAADKLTSERDRRRAAEKRAADAESKVTELEDKFSDSAASIAKVEKRATEAEKKAADAAALHTNYVRKTTLDTTAQSLAEKLSKTSAKVLLPHITARLDMDMTDPNAPKVVVKGADGNASSTTLDQLEKEFRDNKDFSGIITASLASGGGASRQVPTGGHAQSGPTGIPQQPGTRADDLGSMRASDLKAQIDARRAAQGKEVYSGT